MNSNENLDTIKKRKRQEAKIPDDYNLYDDADYIALTDLTEKHLLSIRYQLWLGRKAYKKRMGSSAWGIDRTLEELHSAGIEIGKDTFVKLYDPKYKRSRIDITAVIKLCEIWDLDCERVLALPNEQKLRKSESSNEDWTVLTDPRYAGKYHCYFFQITGNDSFTQDYEYTLRKKETLIKATLDIRMLGDRATATFEYDNSTSANRTSIKFATCTPLLSKLGNVYLDFSDNEGRIYKISFNYRDFTSSNNCYFRIASMLTESSDQVHYPLLQKMVLFRNEPNAMYADHIRGLLTQSNKDVLIMAQELEKLSDDPLIKKFIDNFCNSGIFKSEAFYIFNEDAIMNLRSSMSSYEAKVALTKMRHYSFSPNQLLIGNDQDIHRIVQDSFCCKN